MPNDESECTKTYTTVCPARIWMLFARFSKLNARFTRLCDKSMKSHATKSNWMTQLAFWMLIYIPVVIQFRTNLNERNVNLDAKFTKLGGKTILSCENIIQEKGMHTGTFKIMIKIQKLNLGFSFDDDATT